MPATAPSCDITHAGAASTSTSAPAAALLRPPGVLPYSKANISALRLGRDCTRCSRHVGPQLFAPTNESDPGPGGWPAHIWAAQFPARCERYLLYEDDLRGQGLGFTLNFIYVVRHWPPTAIERRQLATCRHLVSIPVPSQKVMIDRHSFMPGPPDGDE